MSLWKTARLRRRLAALGVWVADARHFRDGQRFLVRTSRNRQRVMRPGTAKAFAARLEDTRWGMIR